MNKIDKDRVKKVIADITELVEMLKKNYEEKEVEEDA